MAVAHIDDRPGRARVRIADLASAEAAGNASLARGDLGSAEATFAALEVAAAGAGDQATIGRALVLRAAVAHRRGQLGQASDRYREAVRRLAEAGDRRAAAVAETRLGAVLVERGRASEALPRLTAALRALIDLGAHSEACEAVVHRGEALLLVGQLDGARAAAETCLARCAGAPQLRGPALVLAGVVAHRLDDPQASRHCRDALAVAVGGGDPRGQLDAHIALAEIGGPAACAAVAIDALCGCDDDRDRWTLARGRLALRDPSSAAAGGAGDSLGEATVALARACAAVAVRAADADRLERAFRGHAIAAQLAHRGRDVELAREAGDRARIAHAALLAATAPAFRAACNGDPDLARLVAAPARTADPGAAPSPVTDSAPPAPQALTDADLRLRPALAALEHTFITAAMARTNGNRSAAARLLGLSRYGLQKKLRRLAAGGDAGDVELGDD